jgi:hypothetical protein
MSARGGTIMASAQFAGMRMQRGNVQLIVAATVPGPFDVVIEQRLIGRYMRFVVRLGATHQSFDGQFSSLQSAKDAVSGWFERQVSPWKDTPPLATV